MGIIAYAFMAYGLTAVISLLVVAVMVLTSKLTAGKGDKRNGD